MNFFGGPCQTKVTQAGSRVFLTFDDGPNESFTPRLLELCALRNFKATFFLVADRAQKFPSLSRAFTSAEHGVGNHSHDHRYGHFFRNANHLQTWIQEAQSKLTELTGQVPVAFRSPAGVRTPELSRALKKIGLPLVHWKHRYFDTVFPWTESSALRAAAKISPGDIILLHDIPRKDPGSFLKALDFLVARLRERGLEPSALCKNDVREGVRR